MPKTWLSALKIIGIVIIALIFIIFTIIVLAEYFPDDIEILNITGEGNKELEIGKDVNIITYNLGYLSLDNTQDFFMDGGKGVRPESATNVTKNMSALQNFIETQKADIYLFQEVDTKAKRSYYINQYEGLKKNFNGNTVFTYMFNSLYIPYPIFNPVGHVESGLATFNNYKVREATRVALPNANAWPKRAVMYKNCLLIERIPVKDSQKELVLINLHLDAYGKGDGKLEQLEILKQIMEDEYNKGNYVIAGGDFNATFPGVNMETFPIIDDKNYVPGTIDENFLSEGWKFAVDKEAPTSRLLNEEYSGNYDNTQLYVIDGFVISPNVELKEVNTIENGFSYSDHQPVEMTIQLK